MRHRYDTCGIVLARSPLGEANALVTLLTPELGLVRARAQSVRTSGAKLAAALTTLTESSLVLVCGKEGWRVTGAIPEEQWYARLPHESARSRVSRVSGLLLRLVAGEAPDSALFPIMKGYLEALATLPEEMHEASEVLVVLRLLEALGLEASESAHELSGFTPDLLSKIALDRMSYVARINTGIAASGL
jgi:DNA repair protein RecO (recombination protein O)